MSRFVALPTITDDSALGGSTIERSLRFNGSDTYIQRTSSGGNRRTWTVSFWMKFCEVTGSTSQRIWTCDGNSGSYDMLKIEFFRIVLINISRVYFICFHSPVFFLKKDFH